MKPEKEKLIIAAGSEIRLRTHFQGYIILNDWTRGYDVRFETTRPVFKSHRRRCYMIVILEITGLGRQSWHAVPLERA